tara:strand:- start:804 stop:1316 length:513 start_codon:yes stop_codon:yes gene_type:complete
MIDLELNKSLFLLFLVVCGNYIGELLGCKTQKLLSENMYMKHIVLLCLIFFTINLIGDKKNHPYEVFKKTLLLWLFYLVLTKMNLEFTIVVLFLLFSLYVFDEYQGYLDESGEEYNKEEYDKNKLYLQYIILGITLFGFVMYFLKQRREHSKNFDPIKFILGTSQCDFKK